MKILLQNLKQKKDNPSMKMSYPSNTTGLPFIKMAINQISINNNLQSIPSNNGVNLNVHSNGANILATEREAINPALPRSKSFFENEYFLEFSMREYISYYLKFLFEGIEKSFNLLYTCSSLNSTNKIIMVIGLCFLDKDGIIKK
jgi:hypothetical protein